MEKEPNPTHAEVQVAPFQKGDGLFATQTTQEGTRIGQYIGAVTIDQPDDSTMCFACNNAFVDGKNGGNFTRKINHSCAPNCRMETWTFEEKGEVYETLVVVASKKISVGNELTISYGDDYNLGTCKCVAGCCRDLPTILLGLLEGAAEPPTLEQHPSMQVVGMDNEPGQLRVVSARNLAVDDKLSGFCGEIVEDYDEEERLNGWYFIASYVNDGSRMVRAILKVDPLCICVHMNEASEDRDINCSMDTEIKRLDNGRGFIEVKCTQAVVCGGELLTSYGVDRRLRPHELHSPASILRLGEHKSPHVNIRGSAASGVRDKTRQQNSDEYDIMNKGADATIESAQVLLSNDDDKVTTSSGQPEPQREAEFWEKAKADLVVETLGQLEVLVLKFQAFLVGARRRGEEVLQYTCGKLGSGELTGLQGVASVVQCKEELVNTTKKHKGGIPLAEQGRTWMDASDIRVTYPGLTAFLHERLNVLRSNLVSMSWSTIFLPCGTTWVSCRTAFLPCRTP